MMIMFLVLMIGFVSVLLIGAISGLPQGERLALCESYSRKCSKIKSVFVRLIASVGRFTRTGDK